MQLYVHYKGSRFDLTYYRLIYSESGPSEVASLPDYDESKHLVIIYQIGFLSISILIGTGVIGIGTSK